ncbi:hypothetical protein Clacol_004418 [Clathrus columnatus]|uniref:Uncharacterized protein n=1 Tax=Clathrus columnatus TaxID=1419009 RepID=A0AAV5A928_9AGAM|nr:hypothetical protein Clacol_004418 [Clathrus columnatus]
MSALPEQPQAFETLINTINTFVGRIKDLEAENKHLREISSNNLSQEKLRPYIFVEQGTRTALVSRHAIGSCQSRLVLCRNLTTALEIKNGKTKIYDPAVDSVIEYAPMKILVRFDHEIESSSSTYWHEVGEWEWNGSFMSVVALATGLKVVLPPSQKAQ